MEIYKWVTGYKGLYMVSNEGNVWSCRSRINLKQSDNYNGYLRVDLSRNGIREAFKVHTLVAIEFIGEKPKWAECIEHINHNRKENKATNLKYSTHSKNNCNSRIKQCSKRRIVMMYDDIEIEFKSITECAKYIKSIEDIKAKVTSMIPEIRKCALPEIKKISYYGYRFYFPDLVQ